MTCWEVDRIQKTKHECFIEYATNSNEIPCSKQGASGQWPSFWPLKSAIEGLWALSRPDLEACKGQLEARQQAGVESCQVKPLRRLQLRQDFILIPHAVLRGQAMGLRMACGCWDEA
eukprot:1158534-Pelagomonas_calceolata.AAC.3